MSAKKPIPPFLRCDYDLPAAAAIQALQRGEASSEQQKQALAWIVNQAAATYGQSFQLEGDRETAFAEGRRYVGNQIVKLSKISLNALRKASTHE